MSAHGPIRVLVVDDSAYSRRTITRMLETSPRVEVVGIARDGKDALRRTFELEPDLITLDLAMPGMDGLTFLRLIMDKRPTPVIVISSRAQDPDVFKALDLGAIDFIAKPTPRATPELESIEHELIRKVHAVRDLRIEKVGKRIRAAAPLARRAARLPVAVPPQAVAIGASTGGPAALMQLFGGFAEAPPCAFLVSQHMPKGFTHGFAERLGRFTPIRAREASGGEEPEPGLALIAPGGAHLELDASADRVVTRCTPRATGDQYAPSVDRLFESAAKRVGAGLLAIVLTGMGDDGCRGVRAVKDAGGTVIAESEESAVIFGMPQQVIRTGAVDVVLHLGEIARAIESSLSGQGAQVGRRKSAG